MPYADPERKRQNRQKYRQANRDRLNDKDRRYYEANRTEISERAAARRAKTPKDRMQAQRKYREHAAEHRAANMARKHGANFAAVFAAMWDAQAGACYLCGRPLERDKPRCVVIEHDHSCCPPARSCEYCRRGLACLPCNMLIGFAADDPDRLRRIADNLETAIALVQERQRERPVAEALWEAS